MMTLRDDFFKQLLDNLHDGVYFVDQERRITYWNKGAERITGFSADEVLGKRCQDNILVHVDGEGCQLCTGTCPLTATIERGSAHESNLFLRHKAGHRVPVSVRVSPIRDEDGHIVGAVESFNDNSAMTAALDRAEQLQELAMLDPVTGVGNRRYVEARLRAALDAFRRYGWPFGVLFVDVDHFKRVNDDYGHAIGDKVLRMVAWTVWGNLRSVDAFGRWGGEEFLGVITNTTEDDLRAMAERSRILVSQSAFEEGPHWVHVTVSIGAAMVREDSTLESLLSRADRLLYQAKANGRNRVELV
jgi:diguanylate cyclase (GGDEF)-like protein/PAS domain S-box-containing protein